MKSAIKEISYLKAEMLVRNYLKNKKNLSQYALESGHSYQSMLSIKNNKLNGKIYSKLVFNILKEMGYEPEFITIKKIIYKINMTSINKRN